MDMDNEYSNVMSQRSDEELIRIVVIQRDDYNQMAVEAAINEIKKRGLKLDEIEKIQEKAIDEDEKIESFKNNVASSSLRIINLFVDTIVIFFISILVQFIILPIDRSVSSVMNYIIFVGVYILYYAIMEIRFKKTIGKYITKTRVTMINEEIPENSDIITRTFCRLIPLDKFSFLFTKFGFHDNFSNTKVVNDNKDK